MTTTKIDNIITQISELSSKEKEKIFDYFESEKREYYFNTIINEANSLENEFKQGNVKAENVNDFLTRIIVENV